MIRFWWRSGSRFGSGSPKSEIRILRIGGGLCSLSIDFLFLAAIAATTRTTTFSFIPEPAFLSKFDTACGFSKRSTLIFRAGFFYFCMPAAFPGAKSTA